MKNYRTATRVNNRFRNNRQNQSQVLESHSGRWPDPNTNDFPKFRDNNNQHQQSRNSNSVSDDYTSYENNNNSGDFSRGQDMTRDDGNYGHRQNNRKPRYRHPRNSFSNRRNQKDNLDDSTRTKNQKRTFPDTDYRENTDAVGLETANNKSSDKLSPNENNLPDSNAQKDTNKKQLETNVENTQNSVKIKSIEEEKKSVTYTSYENNNNSGDFSRRQDMTRNDGNYGYRQNNRRPRYRHPRNSFSNRRNQKNNLDDSTRTKNQKRTFPDTDYRENTDTVGLETAKSSEKLSPNENNLPDSNAQKDTNKKQLDPNVENQNAVKIKSIEEKTKPVTSDSTSSSSSDSDSDVIKDIRNIIQKTNESNKSASNLPIHIKKEKEHEKKDTITQKTSSISSTKTTKKLQVNTDQESNKKIQNESSKNKINSDQQKVKMQVNKSSSSSDSDNELNKSKNNENDKVEMKSTKKKNSSSMDEEVVYLGKIINFENLVDDEETSECLLCDGKGHTSFQCQMICKNCCERYHNFKNCKKPANLSIVMQQFLEFCLKQCCQYDPNETFVPSSQDNLLSSFYQSKKMQPGNFDCAIGNKRHKKKSVSRSRTSLSPCSSSYMSYKKQQISSVNDSESNSSSSEIDTKKQKSSKQLKKSNIKNSLSTNQFPIHHQVPFMTTPFNTAMPMPLNFNCYPPINSKNFQYINENVSESSNSSEDTKPMRKKRKLSKHLKQNDTNSGNNNSEMSFIPPFPFGFNTPNLPFNPLMAYK